MKKLYPFLLLLFVITGCSKDFLKRYEKRIVGTWRLTDVDHRGIGSGSSNNQTFTEGEFIFEDDGVLTYITGSGTTYKGGWVIRLEPNYRDDGNDNVTALFVSVTDPLSQHVKTEKFDEMVFTGTNRFKAYLYSGLQHYVFNFRR